MDPNISCLEEDVCIIVSFYEACVMHKFSNGSVNVIHYLNIEECKCDLKSLARDQNF